MSSDAIEASQSKTLIANQRIAFVGKLGGINRKEARAMVRQQGGVMVDKIDSTVDLIVIGADELLAEGHDDLLNDDILQAASDGRLRIIDETQLWQELGLVDDELEACRLYTPAMLARLLEVPIATIRRWHRRGLIVPVRQVNRLPYFDFEEVASARRIAGLIASGANSNAIEAKLSRLATLFPNVQRPLSQLSVIVEGKNVLLRKGEGLIEPGGQMRIDFELVDGQSAVLGSDFAGEPASVISIHDHEPVSSPFEGLATRDEFLDLATEMEDAHEVNSATEVYRAMGLAFGPDADVCFRLAELLYQMGQLEAARERYYMAVELDAEYVEARASLGCVLMELDQAELAISAFQGALDHHPEYPDVHFHLARLLDDQSRPTDAEIHWKAFLQLAPESPWASEARERLGI